MASVFQPQLSDVQTQRPTSGSFRGIDVSGGVGVLQQIIKNTKKAKSNAKDAKEEEVFSDLVGGALDAEAQVLNLRLDQQALLDRIDTITQGGITPEEQPEALALRRKFDDLKQVSRTNIGNGAFFRAKINLLAQEANNAAPGLADEILTFLNGPLSKLPEATTDTGKARLALFTQAEEIYGPSYTADNVQQMISQARSLVRFEQDVAFGVFTADQMTIKAGQHFYDAAQPVVQKWMTVFNEQGIFGVHDSDLIDLDLQKLKAEADQFADVIIEKYRESGRDLSFDQEAKIRDSYLKEYANVIDIFKDKDFVTRAQLLLDSKKLAVQNQLPMMMGALADATANAGIPGGLALNSLFTPGSKLMEVLMNSNMPFLKGVDGSQLNQTLVRSFNLLLSDPSVKDPSLRKIQSYISTHVLENQSIPQVSSHVVGTMKDLTKDENGTLIPGNVDKAIEYLLENETRKKHLVEGMTEEAKTEFGFMTQDWQAKSLVELQDQLLDSPGELTFRFDKSTQSFVRSATKPFQFGIGTTKRRKALVEGNLLVKNFNNLLALSRDPFYSKIMFDPKELIANALRVIAETEEAILKEEEVKAARLQEIKNILKGNTGK